MAKYAKNTTVAASKTKVQIQELLIDWGIVEFFFATNVRGEGIGFSFEGRLYNWNVLMPDSKGLTDKQYQQAVRQRWRILYMGLKMKLEEIDSGSETFEDQFLSKMVLPNGGTVSDFMKLPENLKLIGQSKMPKLLTG